MSPSAQLTLEQLNKIIEDKMNTDQGAREVQDQVDGEEVLDPHNTSPVFGTVLHTVNNKFELKCLEETVRQLKTHPTRQSSDVCVPGHKYSICGLPRTKSLAYQVPAIWLIVRRWVWDADIPKALVVDVMGLGKTFTSVGAPMISTLLTENVVMGLLLPILRGNTHAEWVNMVQNDVPRIIGNELEWYP